MSSAFTHFNPGRLNKAIEIVALSDREVDVNGFETEGEEKILMKCHAQVTDESGAKALAAGTEFAVAKRRFLIRNPHMEITTDMLIRYSGKDYRIARPPNTYGDSGDFTEIWTELKERQ